MRSLLTLLNCATFVASVAGAEPRIDLLAPSAEFSSDSSHLILADIDQDGDLDLVHLPNGSSRNDRDPHAYWLENLGNRKFAPLHLIHLAPTGPNQRLDFPALINLTGDGAPELFVNLQSSTDVEALALEPALSGQAPSAGISLAATGIVPWHAADLDGDNQGELVQITTVPDTSWTVRIHDRQPDGSFAESLVIETDEIEPFGVSAVQAIDLDSDGDLDLSIASAGATFVFVRTGAREFDPAPVVFEEVYGDVTWTDLNGDGLLDLPYPDGTWQENLGDFWFQPREESPAHSQVQVAVFKTIAPRTGLAALVHAILPTPAGDYELVTIPFDSDEAISRQPAPGNTSNSPQFLRHADLDGDGHADLLHSYSNGKFYDSSRTLAVAWGSPDGLTASMPLVATPSFFHQAFPGDFNKDKRIDLITGPDSAGHYRIRYNQGQAGLGEELVLNGLEVPGTSMLLIGVVDITKDGCLDLVFNYTAEPVSKEGPETAIVVVRGRRDGSFVQPEIARAGLEFTPSPIMDGNFIDWDRDGDLDLVSGGVWRENVKGRFPAGQRHLVGLGTMLDFLGNPATVGGTLTADLDGDRAPDIISIIHGEGEGFQPPKTMLVAYNDGFGGIEAIATLPATLAAYDFLGNPSVPGAVAIADLNSDKLPDFWIREVAGSNASGNSATTDRWLRNPGRGSRDPATWVSQPLPGTVWPGVAFADFDGDRTLEWVSPNGYMKPTRSGPFISETFDFTGGIDLSNKPFRTAADFDGDGDADFIIGGGDSPLLLLGNNLADSRKGRFVQPRPIRWLGQPVVR